MAENSTFYFLKVELGIDTCEEVTAIERMKHKRLLELNGLWKDILTLYGNPGMMRFDPDSFTAIVEPKYNRLLYPSNTTSFLRCTSEYNHVTSDRMINIISEDDWNYRHVKTFTEIYNRSLNKLQRELMAGKMFFHQSATIVCQNCNISKRTYYRVMREAKTLLIMSFCLDYYDDYGTEKHDWLEVSRDRTCWNGGHFYKQDIRDWPEFYVTPHIS